MHIRKQEVTKVISPVKCAENPVQLNICIMHSTCYVEDESVLYDIIHTFS